MRQVALFIFALLFIQGFALDERNPMKVTVDSNLEKDEADDHLHQLERRAISSSELLAR